MPGSGTNVAAMLTNLYRALDNYTSINTTPYQIDKDGAVYTLKKEDGSILTYGFLYNAVRDVVLNRILTLETNSIITIVGNPPVISFTDSGVADYPERLGLPSGAAVVRWTPSGYVVPLENGLDGIAPISRYCYPPAMYYYADTGIQTSDTEIDSDLYDGSSDWDTILGNYQDGAVVSSTTRAVALKDPLHFGVSMLKASIVADAVLEDAFLLGFAKLAPSVSTSTTHAVWCGVIFAIFPVRFDLFGEISV
jgi:hypothetical protein